MRSVLRSVFKVSALLALPFLIPVPGHAAVQKVPLAVTPNDEEYNELRQSVARLADGSYASVWTRKVGENFDVWMQWVRPDGSKVFPGGGRAVANTSTNEFNAVVAPNPAGGAFVAFSRYHPDGDLLQVYVQSYDAAGASRWASGGVFAATPGTGDTQDQTQLVAAPDGGVYLCMEEFHETGTNLSDILCQRFDADGRRLWSDQGITAGGLLGWKVLPKLVRDSGDGVMVVWRNNRNPSVAPQDHLLIEGQHLAADGTAGWGPAGEILRTSNLAATSLFGFANLSAVSDSQGGAVLSFNDWNGQGTPNFDIYAQRVTGEGRLLWGDGVAVAADDGEQENDSIVATQDGGAFVTVWYPKAMQLWLYRLGAGGRLRWKQRLSSPDASSRTNDYGAYASFDQGRLRIAWIHQGLDGDAIDLAIFDLAGHRLNGPAGTPLTMSPNGQFLRGFVFDPARRQGFAVWEDERKGSFDDLDLYGELYRE